MGFVIIIFRNRNSTLKFFDILKKAHIGASVIATPKIVGYSCGICIKIDARDYVLTKSLQVKVNFADFLGFYKLEKKNGSLVSTRI